MKTWTQYDMSCMLMSHGLYDVHYQVYSFKDQAFDKLMDFIEISEPTMSNILRVARDIVGHSSKLSFLTDNDDVNYVVGLIVHEVLEDE